MCSKRFLLTVSVLVALLFQQAITTDQAAEEDYVQSDQPEEADVTAIEQEPEEVGVDSEPDLTVDNSNEIASNGLNDLQETILVMVIILFSIIVIGVSCIVCSYDFMFRTFKNCRTKGQRESKVKKSTKEEYELKSVQYLSQNTEIGKYKWK